jgi:hypothetical protein
MPAATTLSAEILAALRLGRVLTAGLGISVGVANHGATAIDEGCGTNVQCVTN